MTRSVVVKHRNAGAMTSDVRKCKGIAGKCRGIAKLSEEPLRKCSELMGIARALRGADMFCIGIARTGYAMEMLRQVKVSQSCDLQRL